VEGRRPEGHVTDTRNTRMVERSRRQKRMEAYSQVGQDPEGTVARWMVVLDKYNVDQYKICA